MDLRNLLFVTVSVAPRDVEPLLEALASVTGPMAETLNPSLRYEEWQIHAEFPAYREWLGGIGCALAGLPSARIAFRPPECTLAPPRPQALISPTTTQTKRAVRLRKKTNRPGNTRQTPA